jgi:hypothetical protein
VDNCPVVNKLRAYLGETNQYACSTPFRCWKHVNNTGRPYIEEVTESGMSSMNNPLPKTSQQKQIAKDDDNTTKTSIFAILT